MTKLEEGRMLGHYRIAGKIGSGGMGEVYKAVDSKLERPVAIKLLPAWAAGSHEPVERLLREAKLASALHHPHIVTVYSIEEEGGVPYIVMEYVEGETLRSRIQREPLSVEELVEIGAKVADALHAAHGASIIHRDVKSSNILLGADGRVKVVDFGLAKQLAKDGDPSATAGASLTATGAVVGTAAYMSPEQTRGETLDPRTDVFSLGVVLYEAATGRLPFEGPSILSVLHEIALVEPPAPSRARPGLPRSLDAVLARAMAKVKDRRFSTAAELAAALRSLGREGGTDADASTRLDLGERRPQRASNLPVPLTSFVGRRDEMEEVSRLIEGNRLATLTGAGGCGKSRLALQVARNLMEGYPDGAWLVELAPLTDPVLVPQRVAAVFGVREEAGRPLVETLAAALAPRSALLLLDNCEHLTAACAGLAAALAGACPGLRILATSREPLGVSGEVLWRVPPLRVPELKDGAPVSRKEIGRFESVRLFLERATAAQPSFALHESNAAAVAQICARLDGIPLAIELAAARIKVLPVAQILNRLEDRFRLLTGGSAAALPHQQTLRAAVDWSYELLGRQERSLFDRLSVFAGGAALEAVEAVCSGDGLEDAAILDLLAHLVDKSLVSPEEGVGGSARYRLLETLREYGRERLEAAGKRRTLLERHSAHFLAVAEEADPELTGPDQSRWLDLLEEERDNLRQSLEWAVDAGAGQEALRLAGALWRFWWVRGYLEEGRRRIAAALALGGKRGSAGNGRDPGGDGDHAAVAARGKALRGGAVLARGQGDFASARALLDDSLALERKRGDREGIAAALQELGNVADDQGRHEEARALYEESLALRRELGDKRGIAALLHNLGVVAQAQGDYPGARSLYEESLALHRALGNDAWEATSLNALGSVALDQGDHAAARISHEQSLAIHRRLGDKWGIAYSLHELGRIAVLTGDFESGHSLLCESVVLLRELGDRVGVAENLEYFASLAANRAEGERAFRLAGAASALRDSMGAPPTPPDRAHLEKHLASARERLGDAPSAAAFEQGKAMSLDEAIRLAAGDRPGE